MSAPRRTSRPSGCLARGLKIFGGGLLAVFLVFHLLNFNPRSVGLPIGSWPGNPWYIYTTSRITLTFDGQSVELEGTTLCKRNLAFESDGGSAFYTVFPTVRVNLYHCGPEWFATRLEDGSALLVGAHSRKTPAPRTPEGARRSGLSFDPEQRAQAIARIPPAVIWVDDGEAPTRAEYYYSAAALEDPRSRLSDLEIEVSIQPASFLTSLAVWRRPSRPAEVVPGMAQLGSPEYMTALYAELFPIGLWEDISPFAEYLGQFDQARRFTFSSAIPLEVWRSFDERFGAYSVGLFKPFMWIAPENGTFIWARRKSDLYYRASQRIVAVNISVDGLISIQENIPRGVVFLSANTTERTKSEFIMRAGSLEFSGYARDDLFIGESMFFPERDQFAIFHRMRISNHLLQ